MPKIKIIFVILLIIISCHYCISKLNSAFAQVTEMLPEFVSPTPQNNATVDEGSNINIEVETAFNDEHAVLLDWDDSLIGWWRFNEDGDLEDHSSHGNDAANHGATWTADGKYAGGYDFDGTQYLSVPDNNSLDGSIFTFSAWVRNDSENLNWDRIVSKKNEYGDENGWEITLGTDQSQEVYIGTSSGEFAVFDCADFTDNNWHHVAASFTNNSVTLYCDGGSVGTESIEKTRANSNDLLIGKISSEDSTLWRGIIDDAQLYNRALSESEVLAIYDASSNQFGKTINNIAAGTYNYTAYAQDLDGNIESTEERTLNVDGNEDDSETPDIDSIEASIYQDLTSPPCNVKLKVKIEGDNFSDNVEVEIGDDEALSIDRESEEEITAKFCLAKLLDDETDHKKSVKVKNPDSDTEESDEEIDLVNVGYEIDTRNFNPNTSEGVKNIQRALIQLGYLDSQYATGFYGPITTAAVQKFQGDNGIPQTGYVGPLTSAKLKEKLD